MNFALTEEQLAIRDTARRFAEEVVSPGVEEWDESQRFPMEVMRQAAGLGHVAPVVLPEMLQHHLRIPRNDSRNGNEVG